MGSRWVVKDDLKDFRTKEIGQAVSPIDSIVLGDGEGGWRCVVLARRIVRHGSISCYQLVVMTVGVVGGESPAIIVGVAVDVVEPLLGGHLTSD